MAKMFSSSPSSDRLVQICTTLSGWFSHKTAAFSTEQCISRCFFTGLKSLKNYGFICNTIFFFMCTHEHKSILHTSILRKPVRTCRLAALW